MGKGKQRVSQKYNPRGKVSLQSEQERSDRAESVVGEYQLLGMRRVSVRTAEPSVLEAVGF